VRGGVDVRAWVAVGFPVFGPRAIRADAVERAVRAIAAPDTTDASDAALGSVLGCPAREVGRVLEALGIAAPEVLTEPTGAPT
jgi:ATP-dependent RNA helicase SUPV3L1/SUV3